jgi:hypothetical protein
MQTFQSADSTIFRQDISKSSWYYTLFNYFEYIMYINLLLCAIVFYYLNYFIDTFITIISYLRVYQKDYRTHYSICIIRIYFLNNFFNYLNYFTIISIISRYHYVYYSNWCVINSIISIEINYCYSIFISLIISIYYYFDYIFQFIW